MSRSSGKAKRLRQVDQSGAYTCTAAQRGCAGEENETSNPHISYAVWKNCFFRIEMGAGFEKVGKTSRFGDSSRFEVEKIEFSSTNSR